jgi:glutaconate CoA-transferase, subunit A
VLFNLAKRPIFFEGMTNKLCSMKEAIAESVKDSSSLYIEGFTHLICFAAAHEIIRQGRKNLTAVRLTPDLVYDQMIEAGCVGKMIFGWAGNPGVGSLHAFRRAIEKNDPQSLEIEEYSHFGMVSRIQAGAAKLPFWPLHNYAGSHIPSHNPNIKQVECPFTGRILAAVPPLEPDVVILHCQRSDAEGNAQAWGLYGTQKESAFAAKKVIVVAEEIVASSLVRSDPNRTIVPGFLVSHVVHEPWGCHPSFVQGYYDRDNDFYVAWDKISRDRSTYQNYLDEFVYSCADRAAYVKKMGSSLFDKLKAKARVCEGVDYGF